MGSILSTTIEIIHLPAQSGKTRKMTELMNRRDMETEDGKPKKKNTNIVFTSNNKVLNKQTGKRVKTDTVKKTEESEEEEEMEEREGSDTDDESVGDVEMPNNTHSWIGSTPVSDIIEKITLEDVTNIICCANKVRYRKVVQLIQKLYKKKNKYAIQIWIDEADKDLYLWAAYLEQHLSLSTSTEEPFIRSIVLISATINTVIDLLHSKGVDPSLRVYDKTHSEDYLPFSMCEVNTESVESKMGKYHKCVIDVLNATRSEYPLNGTKWFIPTHTTVDKHEELSAILYDDYGFNVLILNGKSKEIRRQRGATIPIELGDDLELSKYLNHLYYAYNLYEQPFAVIGNICIGRGITFASNENGNEFVFTHGSIPPIGNGDEEYQMVARMLGNIRRYNTIENHVPRIFLSPDTKERIEYQETFAINFSRKFYSDGNETTRITESMMKEERNVNPPPKNTSKTKGSSKKTKDSTNSKSVNLRSPMVFPFPLATDESFIKMFKAKKKPERASYVMDFIIDYCIDNHDLLSEKYGDILMEFTQTITGTQSHTTEVPESDGSYKRHITYAVKHFENNTPCALLNFNDKNPNYYKSCWEAFIDTREGRLCVLWQYYP